MKAEVRRGRAMSYDFIIGHELWRTNGFSEGPRGRTFTAINHTIR